MENGQVVAITTTKTSRAQGAAEYWLSDYAGSYTKTLEAAKAAHPRKRKFFELLSFDGWNMTAKPITVK